MIDQGLSWFLVWMLPDIGENLHFRLERYNQLMSLIQKKTNTANFSFPVGKLYSLIEGDFTACWFPMKNYFLCMYLNPRWESSTFLPTVRSFFSMKVFFDLSKIFWGRSLLYLFWDAKKLIPLGHCWAMFWPFSTRQLLPKMHAVSFFIRQTIRIQTTILLIRYREKPVSHKYNFLYTVHRFVGSFTDS